MFEVIKLGGSLLSDDLWPTRFVDWFSSRPIGRAILMVGGGEMIEAMRQLDDVHRLDTAAMHWRCVAMLRHTADIAAELLRRQGSRIQLQQVASLESLAELILAWRNSTSGDRPQLAIVYCDVIYRPDLSATLQPLPQRLRDALRTETGFPAPAVGWETTSDAIAIYIAAVTGAEQCLLLKRCHVAVYKTIAEAAGAGVMDPQASRLAASYPAVSLAQL